MTDRQKSGKYKNKLSIQCYKTVERLAGKRQELLQRPYGVFK